MTRARRGERPEGCPWLLAVVGLTIAAVSPARAATYYAGQAGCSDGGEGSATAPYCTLKRAVSQLKAGDTLNLLNGTFNERLIVSTVGTAESPVVIQAGENANPVIEGQGLSFQDGGLVEVSGASHLTIRGLGVRNSTADCVRVSGGEAVTIDQLQIMLCDQSGLVVNQTTRLKVTASELRNTTACTVTQCFGDALTLNGVNEFEISENFIFLGTRGGIAVQEGSRNGKIYHNRVEEMSGTGLTLDQACDVSVYGNDLYNNCGSGLILTTGTAASGAPLTNRNQIYCNMIWDCTGEGIHFLVQATGEIRENTIYNNVLFGNTMAGLQLEDNAAVVRDNIFRNNIFMGNHEEAILGAAAPANTFSHSLFAAPHTPVGSDAVVGDPLFVDTRLGNFHLTANSPAIDSGFDMGLPRVGPPDIGPYEYSLSLLPDSSGTDASTPESPGPGADRGCGCTTSPRAERIADSWPLVLLALAAALRRRRRSPA